MTPSKQGRRARLVEHILVLLAIAGWTVWFLRDSWQVSSRVENLMLIAPGAALALALCLFIGLRAARDPSREDGAGGGFAPIFSDLRSLGFIGLFAAFIGGLAWGWFDLAAFGFIFASLLLLGERKILPALVFSAAFAGAVTWALSAMVPYPVPSLLF